MYTRPAFLVPSGLQVEKVGVILDALLNTRHHGFPVLHPDEALAAHPRLGTLAGLVQRRHLCVLLQRRVWHKAKPWSASATTSEQWHQKQLHGRNPSARADDDEEAIADPSIHLHSMSMASHASSFDTLDEEPASPISRNVTQSGRADSATGWATGVATQAMASGSTSQTTASQHFPVDALGNLCTTGPFSPHDPLPVGGMGGRDRLGGSGLQPMESGRAWDASVDMLDWEALESTYPRFPNPHKLVISAEER